MQAKTLRDALALAAKIGMETEEQRRLVQYKSEDLLDTAAYIIADAMLAEREKGKE